MTTVPWVTCRKVALARSVAITVAEEAGLDWFRDLHQAERDARVEAMEAKIEQWKADGVVLVFHHPYREAESPQESQNVRRTEA